MISPALIVIATTLGFLGTDRAPGDPSDSDKAARFLWLGMANGRDAIRSGVVRITGRKVDEDAEWGRFDGELELFAAFDRPAGKIRFDTISPIRVAKPERQGETKAAWVAGRTGGKYARTPEKSITWVLDNPSLTIDPPQQEAIADMPPIDIRAFGLLFWVDYRIGTTFETIRDRFKDVHCEKVTPLEGKISRMDYLFVDQRVTRLLSIYVDESKGFATIKIEGRYLQGNRQDIGLSTPTTDESDVTWEEVNGAWVPRTFRLDYHDQMNPASHRRVSYEMTLGWESVNQPVDADLFSVKGMGLTKGLPVIDTRLTKPIVVDTVGGVNRASFFGPASSTPAPARFRWPILLGINAIAMAGLGLYLLRRRMQVAQR